MAQATDVATYHNFIDGAWVRGAGTRYETRAPYDTEVVVGSFERSAPGDMARAVEAAQGALPAWRATPAPVRGRILYEAWALLRARAEDLARTITLETGKVLADARGEVTRAANVLEFNAGEGRRLVGETIPSEFPSNLIMTVRRPLGVVGIITPWNFPLAIPMWKVAPALVCGNTVVLKPATSTPLTAIRLVELFADAGLPPGVLNLVTGSGGELGDALVDDPRVAGLSFTGSTAVGTGLNARAAAHLKKVQCELGGKNALVVLPDADLDLAAGAIISGAFGFCGQRCTATSRVIVHRDVRTPLLDRLRERVEALRVGDPYTDVDMGPVASASQFEQVQAYVRIGREEGATLLAGGDVVDGLGPGYYLRPALFAGVRPEMRIAREEIFGPVLAVLECEGVEHAADLVNATPYGFKVSVYGNDLAAVWRFLDLVHVGMAHVNAPTLGGEVQAPFGGIRASGVGEREQGRAGIHFFTEEQVVYLDYSGRGRDATFM